MQRDDTVEVLGDDCINAVIALQNSLRSKESKLAGYRRQGKKCTMDNYANSAVESVNNVTKHGPYGINAKMNLSKSLKRLLKGILNRFNKSQNTAQRTLYQRNQASKAPTSDQVTPKGQALLDRNYDERLNCKSVRVGTNEWCVWNFRRNDCELLESHLQLYLPNYYRCRKLSVYENEDSGEYFVNCSCLQRENTGIPCECFFTIMNDITDESNCMDIGMIDVRYLRVYHANYGEDSEMGNALYNAQEECFLNEHYGTKISTELMVSHKVACNYFVHDESSVLFVILQEKLLAEEDNAKYPILGANTSLVELEEAEYVCARTETTRLDMELYRATESEDFTLTDISKIVNGDIYDVKLTRKNSRMQEQLKQSVLHEDSLVDSGELPTETERNAMRKDMVQIIDGIIKCDMGCKEWKDKFTKGVMDLGNEYWEKVNTKYPAQGGGEGRLELAGHTMGPGSVNKKRLKGPGG